MHEFIHFIQHRIVTSKQFFKDCHVSFTCVMLVMQQKYHQSFAIHSWNEISRNNHECTFKVHHTKEEKKTLVSFINSTGCTLTQDKKNDTQMMSNGMIQTVTTPGCNLTMVFLVPGKMTMLPSSTDSHSILSNLTFLSTY